MTIDEFLRLISTYGFPTVLSVYLILRLDSFLKEVVSTNKTLAVAISTSLSNIDKSINDIKSDILDKKYTKI